MRHTISAIVENKFGVLARVAGMFSGRGFNIDTLNVAPPHDASLSRITVVLKGDDSALDLCTKQLRKLINVVEVNDLKEGQAVSRELVLVKIKADGKTRPEIMQICDIFRAKIVSVGHKDVIVEATGDESKVTAFLGLIEPFGILALARTGQLALKRAHGRGRPTRVEIGGILPQVVGRKSHSIRIGHEVGRHHQRRAAGHHRLDLR